MSSHCHFFFPPFSSHRFTFLLLLYLRRVVFFLIVFLLLFFFVRSWVRLCEMRHTNREFRNVILFKYIFSQEITATRCGFLTHFFACVVCGSVPTFFLIQINVKQLAQYAALSKTALIERKNNKYKSEWPTNSWPSSTGIFSFKFQPPLRRLLLMNTQKGRSRDKGGMERASRPLGLNLLS